MRIVSGTEKGRKLFTPPLNDKSIRPTSDRAREALFSILSDSVFGAKVLDLFAGTGAIGLEALSRGASCVVFIDNSPLALEILKKNIHLCSSSHICDCSLQIIKHDLVKGLPLEHFPKEIDKGFDLIFADPPYGKNFSSLALCSIAKHGILAKDGIVIVEERFNISLPNVASPLRLIDKRVYGEAGFWFYKSFS